MSWYNDLTEMETDDAHLQRNFALLTARMCPSQRRRLRAVHVYPSQSCTYTIEKRRVFVCPRDSAGQLLPDCAVQHVLLHELAHALNQKSQGHDDWFARSMGRLERCVSMELCEHHVPPDYNSKCKGRG